MGESKQLTDFVRPNVIRNFGIALFLLSFVIPSGNALLPKTGEHVNDYLKPFEGFWVFVQTPALITFLPLFRGPPIDDGFTPYEIFIRVILFGAWLTNFSVFFRLPAIAAIIAIFLPWATFIFWFDFAVGFVPFYFWALGISLVHWSKMLKSKSNYQSTELRGQG